MMDHGHLQGAARLSHREIGARLPSLNAKRTMLNLLENQELEIIEVDNTGFDEDDNSHIRIDLSDPLPIEKRESGSWVNKQMRR